MKSEDLTVNKIIRRRAAYCIQSWYSSLKLKKRLQALANIKRHVMKITSHEVYLEQSIYENINSVVNQSHQSFRFKEQSVMFDFNPVTYGIFMQVEEAADVNRYINCSAPIWFGVDI